MMGNVNFSHLRDIQACPVGLPNGSQMQDTQEGDVYLGVGFTLGNVLYVLHSHL